MPGLIAVVQANIDGVRIVLGYIHKLHANAFEPSEVARGGSVRASARFGCRVDGVNVVVFVAVVIFHVKNVFAVAAPEIAGDRALEFSGEQPCRVERLVHALDIDVARVFPWLLKRQILSVGRQLRTRDFGIPEDQLAVDQRWQTCGSFLIAISILRCERRDGERQTQ